MSPTLGARICAIIARVKKYKPIIKNKKKKHDEMELLVKTNFKCIKDSISRSLNDLYIRHNYFLLIHV